MAIENEQESHVRADDRLLAQLRMLHSLATRISGLNDAGAIGRTITSELRILIDYHNCRVYVREPGSDTLTPIAFEGTLLEYSGETFDALLTKVGEGITGRAAETGVYYYAPDAGQDPTSVHIPGTPLIDESILAVPLRYADEVVGVVVLSKRGIDQFDHSDIRVLEVLASHVAVALQNARLLRLEREAAERARESEARKAAIVESALDCIVVMDHQGMVVEFNPAAQRTFGYTREEAIGAEMAELIIPPEYRDRHRQGLVQYMETGVGPVLGRRLEMPAMRADGTQFPVELAIARVDLPGKPLFTGYLKDITQRKRAEAEAAAALETEREVARQLRELDEMKNTFLQAVSHDLRTPLAAVYGLALTLERTGAGLSEEDRSDLTKRLAAGARRLDRILSNLLDLDRLVRGVVTPRYEIVDVGALVVRVVAEADLLAGRDVRVQTRAVTAEADPVKLERILENLLVNAAKHTPADCPVWVRAEEDGDNVLIVVEDAGPGVPVDLRTRIFEAFRRGDEEESSPGSGIGLSVVQQFAQLHGGRAWVEAREGGGASFRVLLPRHRAVEEAPQS